MLRFTFLLQLQLPALPLRTHLLLGVGALFLINKLFQCASPPHAKCICDVSSQGPQLCSPAVAQVLSEVYSSRQKAVSRRIFHLYYP